MPKSLSQFAPWILGLLLLPAAVHLLADPVASPGPARREANDPGLERAKIGARIRLLEGYQAKAADTAFWGGVVATVGGGVWIVQFENDHGPGGWDQLPAGLVTIAGGGILLEGGLLYLSSWAGLKALRSRQAALSAGSRLEIGMAELPGNVHGLGMDLCW